MGTIRRGKPVTAEEARDIALRFIDHFFNNGKRERPRATIPADPERDSDLRLMQFVEQYEAMLAALASIERWDMPTTSDALAHGYHAGSLAERDIVRRIAREAIAAAGGAAGGGLETASANDPKPNPDAFLVDVTDFLAYVKQHEGEIYVRAKRADGTFGSTPLKHVAPADWARFVHGWMRDGRTPVRVFSEKEEG